MSQAPAAEAAPVAETAPLAVQAAEAPPAQEAEPEAVPKPAPVPEPAARGTFGAPPPKAEDGGAAPGTLGAALEWNNATWGY